MSDITLNIWQKGHKQRESARENIKKYYSYDGLYTQMYFFNELVGGRGDSAKVAKKAQKQGLPPGAENWFAVPYWRAVDDDYEAAADIMLRYLATKVRGFLQLHDFSDIEMSERKLAFIDKLYKQQRSEVIIFPAQFGARHRNVPTLQLDREDEFPLGVVEVAAMLMIHRDRMRNEDSLGLDLSGDILTDLNRTVKINYFLQKFRVGSRKSDDRLACRGFGHATGFFIKI